MKNLKKLLCVMTCFFVVFAGITFADNIKVSATSTGYTRLGGTTRYLTSVQISQNGWPDGSANIVIASGEDYPDALCAAPLAKLYNAPILLTYHDSLYTTDVNHSLVTEIQRLKPTHAFIVGGTGAISSKVESELKSLGISYDRLWGQTRYETSLAIAERVYKDNSNSIGGIAVASGENYPDALSIASIAAAKTMPILLTEKSSMKPAVQSFISNYNKGTTYVIGGSGVIIDSLCSSLPNNKRLGGVDRYHTNLAVINEFTSSGSTSLANLYVAQSYGFADALSGSAEAAKDNAAILLASSNDISDREVDSLNFIHSNLRNINCVKVLGGTGVISDSLANKVINPVRTVLGFTDAGQAALDTMTAYNSTIDEIGICKYSAESDGTIACSTTAPITSGYAKSAKIKALTVVSDGWNSIVHTLLSNPSYRQNFITNLLKDMGDNGRSGVNIDFEHMTAVDRDNFSTFIQELSSALHKSNYLLTVSVVAKTFDDPNDNYAGPYDYAAIGQYADQVAVMTYWENGSPTCQYPIKRVTDDIEYALKVIPRNKILLGLGAYATDWCEYTDSKGNPAYTRTSFDIAKAYSLANQYNNGKFYLDSETECEYFDYTDSLGNKHEVWFDDATTVAYKLKLVNDNDLGGVAIWQLAYPDAGYMNQIKSMLQK